MNHIKSKKVFESLIQNWNSDEVLNTIKDICLELEDKGFEVNYRHGLSPKTGIVIDNMVYITIRRIGTHTDSNGIKIGTSFKYGEIEEVVQRLKDYLKTIGIEERIRVSADPKTSNLISKNDSYRYVTLQVYTKK